MPRKAKPGDRGTRDQKELGILMKEHREGMNLSQQGLSDLMKGRVSAQVISRYENGGDVTVQPIKTTFRGENYRFLYGKRHFQNLTFLLTQ